MSRVSRTLGFVERVGVDRADEELLRVLDRDFAEARQRGAAWLKCDVGCADCCHGPFPITRLDVRRLQRGLAATAAEDPDLAAAIRDRARAAVARLTEGFPGDARTGRLIQDEHGLDVFLERHGSLPCPALDPASGRCELYAWRPVSCRTFGPPVRFGEQDSPPCDLCFRGAEVETVERCRVEPDREGLEEAILNRLRARPDEDWETLIAFVLADSDSGPPSTR